MPIYEYRCENGHLFEVMQRMADDPLSSCATCGAPVQRVFHPVAVHFKGSGFYNTDYGKQKKGGDSAPGGDTGKSEGKAASGSESKSSDSSSKQSDSKTTAPSD